MPACLQLTELMLEWPLRLISASRCILTYERQSRSQDGCMCRQDFWRGDQEVQYKPTRHIETLDQYTP